jgi:hypothetical protein
MEAELGRPVTQHDARPELQFFAGDALLNPDAHER